MNLTVRSLLFGLALLVTISYSSAEKDESESAVDQADSDLMEADKRGLMRYGRGSVFRYGKRADADDYEGMKRVFRYGKRGDVDFKRVFRYGKRDYGMDDEDLLDEDKRIFRYGKRGDDDEKRRIFRYGKRDGDSAFEKRPVFRYGKRSDLDELLEEAKRRIMRYGRETRTPQEPHMPYRFGEEEE